MRWGKHHSETKNISREITINKKTNKEIKLLVGKCMVCNRKKSMIVSDNTIKAEGLGSFFKNLGKISSKAGKKLATNELKNPGRALEIRANIATAAATKSPKAALSTLPEVINFSHTGKGFILGNLYKHSYSSTNNNYNYTYRSNYLCFLYNKWNKNVKNYIPQHHC